MHAVDILAGREVIRMIRLYILAGFAFMFLQLHLNGNLNKYINTKYAYLSISAIVLLTVLFLFEVVHVYMKESAEKRARQQLERAAADPGDHPHASHELHGHEHHNHGHAHGNDLGHSFDDHGHSHGESSKLRRTLGYIILIFPILTGIFLPVQTLDSSFVKAKGFSFPNLDVSADNPGYHQFLKPDTSVFYGKDGYKEISQKELLDFAGQKEIDFNDQTFLKGLEALYNFPEQFKEAKIGINGFVYKGEQVDDSHYFVFRFGFIHCVADSGVFGMLVQFPKGTHLEDNQWVHVTGTLSTEFYQPFKQNIPMLVSTDWNEIEEPSDPYVYRTF